MNFNEISKLKEKDFKCLPQLAEIKLGHNNIVEILDFTFRSLSKVKALFLNENKIIYLYKYSFHGLIKLTVLNLLHNNILKIEKGIFSALKVQYILIDHFQVCCNNLEPKSICTAKPQWPSSCESLFSNVRLKVSNWCIGISVFCLNIIFMQNYQKYVQFKRIETLLQSCYANSFL